MFLVHLLLFSTAWKTFEINIKFLMFQKNTKKLNIDCFKVLPPCAFMMQINFGNFTKLSAYQLNSVLIITRFLDQFKAFKLLILNPIIKLNVIYQKKCRTALKYLCEENNLNTYHH